MAVLWPEISKDKEVYLEEGKGGGLCLRSHILSKLYTMLLECVFTLTTEH